MAVHFALSVYITDRVVLGELDKIYGGHGFDRISLTHVVPFC